MLGLGDASGAERELQAAREAVQIPAQRFGYYRARVELALLQERMQVASAYVDSMFLDAAADQQPLFQTVVGRFSLDRNAADPRGGVASRTAILTLYAGVVPAAIDSLIRTWAELRAAQAGPEAREGIRAEALTLASMVGFHARSTGPVLDTASVSPLLRYQAFFAKGDTARARHELAAYDKQVADDAEDMFDGGELFAAESHLELGDSTVALDYMKAFVAKYPHIWSWPNTTMPFGRGLANGPARLYPRAWLFYADLCLAKGLNDEARRGYRNVVGLWERGEAPVQPLVARAKSALAKLGG